MFVKGGESFIRVTIFAVWYLSFWSWWWYRLMRLCCWSWRMGFGLSGVRCGYSLFHCLLALLCRAPFAAFLVLFVHDSLMRVEVE